MAAPNEFTTTEAAALTEQPVNRIQKFIDSGPIPRRARRGQRPARLLTDCDLMFVWIVARAFAGTDLDARLKALLYQRVTEGVLDAWTTQHDELKLYDFFVVRGLKRLTSELKVRVKTLAKARAMVVTSPEIKGGEAVIKGTRIPVYLVATMLDQGTSPAEIVENYPTLDERKVELARVYARATPRQGRPPKHPWR